MKKTSGKEKSARWDRRFSFALAALLLLVSLAGCNKPVSDGDRDRIATYYFNSEFGIGGWSGWTRLEDTVCIGKDAYQLSASPADGGDAYVIAICKDGAGVWCYSSAGGGRIGGSDVEWK